MPDGYVKEAVQTTGGATWYRATDSQGRDYVVKQGDGIQGYMSGSGRQKWAAAKSHSPEVAVAERGESIDRALRGDERTADALSVPTSNMDPGTVEYRLGVNKNRWLGFLNAEGTPNDPEEAFKDYSNMIDELKEAESPEEERDIRKEYGVGDS